MERELTTMNSISRGENPSAKTYIVWDDSKGLVEMIK